MKKLILSPLFLGLVLAGCSRTETDSKKLSSNDQSDANKPVYNDPAVTAPKDTSKPAEVAAAETPATIPAKDASADATKSAPDSSMMAADSTTAASKDPTALAPPVAPAAGPADAMTSESPQVAANPPASATLSPADMAEGGAKPAIAERIAQWKLSSDEIKSEFDASGRVARSKTLGAGEPTGLMDDLLVTLVSGKLKDDADTSALKIAVTANKGVVTLTGSAHSLDQIGKAVALALDTNGANQAISTITLDPAL